MAKGGYLSVAKVGTDKQPERYPDNEGPSRIYPLLFQTHSSLEQLLLDILTMPLQDSQTSLTTSIAGGSQSFRTYETIDALRETYFTHFE